MVAQFRADFEAARKAPRPVFEKYLPALGPVKLLNALEETYPACHAQAHALGRAIFAATHDVEQALSECGTACTSGCMHGVVAEAFGGESIETVMATMNAFCSDGEMARLHKPGNCAHGLGHALMLVTHDDVARAIDGCLGFTGAPMQYYCATGVYMQKFVTDRNRGAAPGTAYSPCDREHLFPGACYRYKGAEQLEHGRDHAQVAADCLRLTGSQRRGCFHGLGYASIAAVFRDPGAITDACTAGDAGDQTVCIEGVTEKLAQLDEVRARKACASLNGELRAVCAQAAERKMYGVSKPTFGLYYDTLAIAARRAEIARSTR
jgi:hypothetical protein